MILCDGSPMKQVDSWEQIKLRLNENLLKKNNTNLEYRADTECHKVKHINSADTLTRQGIVEYKIG